METRFQKKPLLIASVLVVMAALLSACGAEPNQNTTEGKKDDDSSPAIEVAWSMESDCATCHQSQGSTMEDTQCMAGQHAAEASATCISCHTDESALQKVHENAPAGSVEVKMLKKTSIDEATCLSCHDSKESLAEKTADSTVLQDHNGLVVNPHAMPDTPGHEGEGSCNSCHKAHDGESAQELAPEYCFSCHHEEVFECGTCH